MQNLIQWFVANGPAVMSVVAAVIVAARLIVKLTPTPKDDTVLEKVIEFLKHVGLQIKD